MGRRYPPQEFTNAGKLIARLTHGLAQIKDWSMEETMRYVGEQTRRSSDMVYRWQQGRLLPKPTVVETLARIGYREADLSREWCEALLHATRYPDTTNLLNELWGTKELRVIPHRLTRREHTRLIGRQQEAQHLQTLLSPRLAANLITVDGIGGVGKTALVLDIAYRSLQASTGEITGLHIPLFEAIIFVSAKQEYLTVEGILKSDQANRTLRKIFQEITFTLKRDDIRSTPVQEQAELIREALSCQRTLLIVDNLETVEDKQGILSFLYELPPTTKVVITTRERAMFSPIRLEQLMEEAALELIEQQAQEKQAPLREKEPRMLYQRIGGIPAALIYAVGQRAAGYSLEAVLHFVSSADGDVARFCFQGSVASLRGKPAHAMLMAFALFPQMPLRSTVTFVAGLEADFFAAEEALSQLQRLSLVREFHDRFRMLPLTREYAMAELRAHPDFEQEARERWLSWCANFTQQYGGHDMEEWHMRYDHLNEEWENLLAVFDWCACHERYDILKSCWCAEERGSVVDFSTLYGHWDDRLTWLSWLMKTAEGRADWPTTLDAIASYGVTLTLISRYDDAESLFAHAQRLRRYAEPAIEARLLINHAYLYIFLERFAESSNLLDQAMAVARRLQDPLQTRLLLNIEYDQAAIRYWRGEYKAARVIFCSVMQRANTCGWQSLANYAQNYLADIALHDGDLDEAEQSLQMMTHMPMSHPFRRPAVLGELPRPLLLAPIATGRSYFSATCSRS
ncbi:MAG TPA: NB-ARC domain-containing protein, partial [Ktedonobacteraceae bacterium]